MIAISLEFHAILSAYLSIGAGLIEATLSIMAGHADISMSLYGVALMAITDVIGGLLILLLWQCRPNGNGPSIEIAMRIKDLRYTSIIGLFMVFMGVFLMIDRLEESEYLLFVHIDRGPLLQFNN
jgi:hypothetical protein